MRGAAVNQLMKTDKKKNGLGNLCIDIESIESKKFTSLLSYFLFYDDDGEVESLFHTHISSSSLNVAAPRHFSS